MKRKLYESFVNVKKIILVDFELKAVIIPLIDNKLNNESFLTDLMSKMDKAYKMLILYVYFVYTL
jgi:hypothetical protein